MGFLRDYRGALLVVSHDLALLDTAITRVLHLDEGELVEYRGPTRSTARRAPSTRPGAPAWPSGSRRRSPASRPWPTRCAARPVKRARTAHSLDSRVRRLQAEAVGPASRERKHAVRFPPPPHSGRVLLEVEGLTKSYGGPPVFEDVDFAVERGERLLVLGLNGAGKTSLLRILAGPDGARRRRRPLRRERVGRLLRPGARGHRAGRQVLDHLAEGSSAAPQELRACSACSGSPARWRSRTPGRSRAARRPSWRWPSSWPAATTCCCSTSPPTTSTRRRARPSARPSASGRARWCSSATTPTSSPSWRPTGSCSCPTATLDWWSDDLLELVALA